MRRREPKQVDKVVGYILTNSKGDRVSAMAGQWLGLGEEALARARAGERVQTDRGVLTWVDPAGP